MHSHLNIVELHTYNFASEIFVCYRLSYRMWRPIKAIFLAAASVIAVPYAIAVLANILYGWPLGPRRYHRALHPLKVLALNYAVVRQLSKVRYLGLALRWRQFYVNAPPTKLLRVTIQFYSKLNVAYW